MKTCERKENDIAGIIGTGVRFTDLQEIYTFGKNIS